MTAFPRYEEGADRPDNVTIDRSAGIGGVA
jgi:hypothetical protein